MILRFSIPIWKVAACQTEFKSNNHRCGTGSSTMAPKLYAQGDVLLELVEDAAPSLLLPRDPDDANVLSRGELTDHRHSFYGGGVMLFRDDALARDVPPGLYIGHVKVTA